MSGREISQVFPGLAPLPLVAQLLPVRAVNVLQLGGEQTNLPSSEASKASEASEAKASGGNSAEAGSGWGAFSRYSLASDARAASCCWQLLRLALSVPIVLRSFLISSFPAKGEESCFAYQRLCWTKGSWSCCICSWLACFQKGCRTEWCLLQ